MSQTELLANLPEPELAKQTVSDKKLPEGFGVFEWTGCDDSWFFRSSVKSGFV
jgi:hypothetical protein